MKSVRTLFLSSLIAAFGSLALLSGAPAMAQKKAPAKTPARAHHKMVKKTHAAKRAQHRVTTPARKK